MTTGVDCGRDSDHHATSNILERIGNPVENQFNSSFSSSDYDPGYVMRSGEPCYKCTQGSKEGARAIASDSSSSTRMNTR